MFYFEVRSENISYGDGSFQRLSCPLTASCASVLVCVHVCVRGYMCALLRRDALGVTVRGNLAGLGLPALDTRLLLPPGMDAVRRHQSTPGAAQGQGAAPARAQTPPEAWGAEAGQPLLCSHGGSGRLPRALWLLRPFLPPACHCWPPCGSFVRPLSLRDQTWAQPLTPQLHCAKAWREAPA